MTGITSGSSGNVPTVDGKPAPGSYAAPEEKVYSVTRHFTLEQAIWTIADPVCQTVADALREIDKAIAADDLVARGPGRIVVTIQKIAGPAVSTK